MLFYVVCRKYCCERRVSLVYNRCRNSLLLGDQCIVTISVADGHIPEESLPTQKTTKPSLPSTPTPWNAINQHLLKPEMSCFVVKMSHRQLQFMFNVHSNMYISNKNLVPYWNHLNQDFIQMQQQMFDFFSVFFLLSFFSLFWSFT